VTCPHNITHIPIHTPHTLSPRINTDHAPSTVHQARARPSRELPPTMSVRRVFREAESGKPRSRHSLPHMRSQMRSCAMAMRRGTLYDPPPPRLSTLPAHPRSPWHAARTAALSWTHPPHRQLAPPLRSIRSSRRVRRARPHRASTAGTRENSQERESSQEPLDDISMMLRW